MTTLKTRLALVLILAGAAIAAYLLAAPKSHAVPPGPGSCVSGGGGFIGWGRFRDCDLWSDGSYFHEVYGGGPFASGGWSGRVCDSPRGNPMPPVTDWDPATKCPGW